jgi:hypothetical protein
METKILYNFIVLEWNVLKIIELISKKTNISLEDLEKESSVFIEENYENIVKLIGNSGEEVINQYETEKGELYYGTEEWIVSQSNIE